VDPDGLTARHPHVRLDSAIGLNSAGGRLYPGSDGRLKRAAAAHPLTFTIIGFFLCWL
jgi:hypothetical protein